MRYLRFVIRNYRAITQPLEIDVARHSLMPIIGVNECGKTTILHAIFAFDFLNDKLNDNGRHLKDTRNLYQTGTRGGRIAAVIEISKDEYAEVLADLEVPATMTAALKTHR